MPFEITNLSYTYSRNTPFETKALDDVSLKIENGEFVGIMGHTGCGKSTLIQLMDGLMKPESGRILLDGRNINDSGYDRTKLRQKVGLVFQYPEYQLFETTVERDVTFGLKHLDLPLEEKRSRAKWALETVGFDFNKIAKQSPESLSGGEKRRVAIAGILAVKPDYLVFDEPVAGLDPLGRDAFLSLMVKLNAAGTTIIIVSHNADALADHAKRIVVLDEGKIILDGSPQTVFGNVGLMEEKNLGVSQSAQTAYMLRQRGFDIGMPVTKDALFASIKKAVMSRE